MYAPPAAPRYRSFHGPKRQVLGNNAGQVPPAWRISSSSTTAGTPHAPRKSAVPVGSKILLSQLPADVGEKEVEELFKKTVGPLKESFLVYNSAGRSKGMAIVWFQRPEDAALAKNKYDGKFVDGRKPIKIEIITDKNLSSLSSLSSSSAPSSSSTPQAPLSLIDRIQGRKPVTTPTGPSTLKNHSLPRQEAAVAAMMASPASSLPTGPSTNKRRVRKGPKRLKKQQMRVQFAKVHPSATTANGAAAVNGQGGQKGKKSTPKSREQLDQEMDDWMAESEE
ncbi:hypothetical protein K435DRAFT_854690 [Dendrothele bispora CBS 962.96]|uniref:RRM domain-containing protein n=1 Tax=Dendrothele bispora (strain CBS 962.96) TaxID=1314807 RepID=A0A4S8MDK0_DENBC|nr:hypothetical protein K435DRAFT_854690 [Dendrothele bispora CBS 962.96]